MRSFLADKQYYEPEMRLGGKNDIQIDFVLKCFDNYLNEV